MLANVTRGGIREALPWHHGLVRFFTRGWHQGDLSDEEYDQTVRDYDAHLEAISARLPDPVVALAREVNLHDAVIERVEWEPASARLVLRLVTWTSDSRQAVTLTYSDAMLGDQRLDVLKNVARDRKTEILYSEVDLGEDGVLAHRLLFWPRDELTIDFGTLTLEVQPRADDRVQLGPFFLGSASERRRRVTPQERRRLPAPVFGNVPRRVSRSLVGRARAWDFSFVLRWLVRKASVALFPGRFHVAPATPRSDRSALGGIKGVAESVANVVDGDDHHHEDQPWEEESPPMEESLDVRIGHDVPQARLEVLVR